MYTPGQTPLRQTPPGQSPPWADTPRQIPTPPPRQTPKADILLWADTPQADTPLLGRQTSPGQTPPVDTKGRPPPLPLRQTPKADLPLRWALQRTVRMLLECILVLIQVLAQSLPINRLTTPHGLAPPV